MIACECNAMQCNVNANAIVMYVTQCSKPFEKPDLFFSDESGSRPESPDQSPVCFCSLSFSSSLSLPPLSLSFYLSLSLFPQYVFHPSRFPSLISIVRSAQLVSFNCRSSKVCSRVRSLAMAPTLHDKSLDLDDSIKKLHLYSRQCEKVLRKHGVDATLIRLQSGKNAEVGLSVSDISALRTMRNWIRRHRANIKRIIRKCKNKDEKYMLKKRSKKDMQRSRRTCMWVSQVPALYEMEDNNSTDVDSISSDITSEQREILRDDAGVIVREVRPRRVVGG